MNLENLHSKLDSYDLLIEEAQQQWKELHKLKPKGMNELQFQNLIQQTRLDNNMINAFLRDDPYKCKNLIYRNSERDIICIIKF